VAETIVRLCRWLAALTLLLMAGCADTGAGPHGCALTPLASIPLRLHRGLLLVDATVADKPVTLVVDTGAERTTLTEAAVARLGLPHDGHASRSVGIGGITASFDVQIPGLGLGTTRFPLDRLAVGRFHIDLAGAAVAGLLGADILLAFELDLDIPARRMTIYRLRRCDDAAPPWPAVEISGVTARRDRMLVPILLDGIFGKAVLDTGAQTSAISEELAARAGVTKAMLADDPRIMVHGAAPNPVPVPIHRFHSLFIGGEQVADPRIDVVPSAGLGDGLIGADFIRGRRLWLAFPSRRLFIATVSSATNSSITGRGFATLAR
jgi:predicted aspartyl protease